MSRRSIVTRAREDAKPAADIAPKDFMTRAGRLAPIRLAGAVCAFGLTAACTIAEERPPKVYFSNAVVVTQPWGEIDRLVLERDGTYTLYGVKFGVAHGQWRYIKAKQELCLRPLDTPQTKGQEFCHPLTGRKVGDRWTAKISGYDIPFEIVKGRAPR